MSGGRSRIAGKTANGSCSSAWRRGMARASSRSRYPQPDGDALQTAPHGADDFETVRAAELSTGRRLNPAQVICDLPLDRFGLSSDRLQKVAQRAPQAVDLVDDAQNDGDSFIVDAKIVLQVPDQRGPRKVRLRERWRCFALTGDKPTGLDPGLQGLGLDPRPHLELAPVDHSRLHVPAGVVRFAPGPVTHERLKIWIAGWQHHLQRHILVAASAVLSCDAFAFEAQHSSRFRALWH